MAKNTYGETLLINEELFKLYSQVSRNVGVDKVYPYLQLAQPFFLEPILGTPLLNELQYQIENNTLTELNKALILKIAPALALYTDFLAARSLAWQINEKGITKSSSENSEPINEKELGFLINQYRENADMAADLLIKYLCRCQDSYPLFRPSSDCDCAKYMPTDGSTEKQLTALIYFPSGKRSGCPDCSRD